MCLQCACVYLHKKANLLRLCLLDPALKKQGSCSDRPNSSDCSFWNALPGCRRDTGLGRDPSLGVLCARKSVICCAFMQMPDARLSVCSDAGDRLDGRCLSRVKQRVVVKMTRSKTQKKKLTPIGACPSSRSSTAMVKVQPSGRGSIFSAVWAIRVRAPRSCSSTSYQLMAPRMPWCLSAVKAAAASMSSSVSSSCSWPSAVWATFFLYALSLPGQAGNRLTSNVHRSSTDPGLGWSPVWLSTLACCVEGRPLRLGWCCCWDVVGEWITTATRFT